MLYSEDELLKLLNNAGITALKCDLHANHIQLHTNDINVLIDYAKINQIKHIFYCYDYLDVNDYILPDENGDILENYKSLITPEDKYPSMNPLDYEESLNEYFNDLYNLSKQDIKNYKHLVNSIDFEKPIELSLICLHNGTAITMNIIDSWDSLLQTSESFITSLQFKYRDELKQRKAMRIKEICAQKEKTLKELREIILSDSEFAKCTNQKSRLSYIKDLLNRPESRRFRQAFSSEIGYVIWYEAGNFVDKLYSEIKNKNT